MADTISPARARRIALAAQGFAAPKPAVVGTRQLNLLIERLGLLQIDSVNVFERSHYLPVFARLGGYDKALLDKLTFGNPGARAKYFEYWGHAAAIMPVDSLPAMRWRMRQAIDRNRSAADHWVHSNQKMMDWLKAELADKGPMTASEFEHVENRRTGPWWGWSDVKIGLEVLFMWGEVFSAGRTRFERRYGLAEQVLPPGALDVDLSKADAIRQLLLKSVQAHGIGTLYDLADYYRLGAVPTSMPEARIALAELVDSGQVLRVQVPGWKSPAYLDPDARAPHRIDTVALLSPFDPIVWERDRAIRLFDFDYKIEIYLKPENRQYGYYTLPVLMDDAIVGRIDLKSDRQRKVLMVQSAWREPLATAGIEERIAPLLRETAAWQNLESIEVAAWGDLAPALAGELGVPLKPRG